MSGTSRKCGHCGEWYDARAASCYVCGEEERDFSGIGAFKAARASEMNGHLSQQMRVAGAEARAEQQLRSARSGEAYAAVRPAVPGYRDLVDTIKSGLEERPHVADYYGAGER